MSDRRNFSINQNLFNFNKKDKKIFRRAGDTVTGADCTLVLLTLILIFLWHDLIQKLIYRATAVKLPPTITDFKTQDFRGLGWKQMKY